MYTVCGARSNSCRDIVGSLLFGPYSQTYFKLVNTNLLYKSKRLTCLVETTSFKSFVKTGQGLFLLTLFLSSPFSFPLTFVLSLLISRAHSIHNVVFLYFLTNRSTSYSIANSSSITILPRNTWVQRSICYL